MSYVGSFPIEGEIIVIPHVLDRARERHPDLGKRTRSDDERLLAFIERSVRHAIEQGRVYSQKPKPFRRLGETKNFELPSWQRVVIDQNNDVAWVVALDKPPDVIVLTVLDKTKKIRTPW